MSIEVNAKVDERGVDAAFRVPSGEVWSLVGPNGCGKSTILDTIAGLLEPDSGHINVGGRTVFANEPGTSRQWVPPHLREIAFLAQQPTLFPHLTAQQNVEFGPRSRGFSRAAAKQRATEMLEQVQMGQFAERRPHELSGGQAQRIALARALAADPQIVLLDEPMAALDAEAVPFMRRLLVDVLRGRTALLVTHDPLDALALSSNTVVVVDGKVADIGPTDLVLGKPRTEFTASMGGMNLVRGVALDADSLDTPDGRSFAGTGPESLQAGEPALAVFSPRSVVVSIGELGGSPRNSFGGAISSIEQRDGICRLQVGDIAADVTVQALVEMGLEVGTRVNLAVKAMEVTLHRS